MSKIKQHNIGKKLERAEKRKTLYDISYEYEQTLRELEDWMLQYDSGDGEVPEEFLERLNINQNELEEKLYGYYMVIQSIKATDKRLKEEKARIDLKRHAHTRRKQYLENLVEEAVNKFGQQNKSKNYAIKTDVINVTHITSEHLIINEVDAVPEEYLDRYLLIKIDEVDYSDFIEMVRNQFVHEIKKEETLPDMDVIKEKYRDKKADELPHWLDRVTKGYLRFS